MDSYAEMRDTLADVDREMADMGRETDAYLVGQAVLMYHGEQAGADIDYRDTDDADIVVPDAEAAFDLSEAYGSGFGLTGTRLEVDHGRYVDVLMEHAMADELIAEEERGNTERIAGLDNLRVHVPSPEFFTRDKHRVYNEQKRPKDLDDIERMAEVRELLGDAEVIA